MGMYDNVKCEHQLPGNPPENFRDLEFQTKDLECLLDNYTITADGKLMRETYRIEDRSDPTKEGLVGLIGCCTHIPTGQEFVEKTCTVEIYCSNVVASGPGVYTRDGEDAHYLEYKIEFVKGQLSSIVETRNEKHRAMKRKYPQYKPPSEEEKALRKQREEESLLGREMCVWYGGDTQDGETVTVIAENDSEWLTQYKDNKKFQQISRWQRDITFFDSYEDGKAYKEKRRADWEAEKKEYEDHITQGEK